MGNGTEVPSEDAWVGAITIKSVRHEGTFEIFDSDAGWSFLFGKPLQSAFGAVHDYKWDIVESQSGAPRRHLPISRGSRENPSRLQWPAHLMPSRGSFRSRNLLQGTYLPKNHQSKMYLTPAKFQIMFALTL
jgi:hypothetical protein